MGGIQSYLWELWRRLDPQKFTVITPKHPQSTTFDAAQPFAVERMPQPFLLPSRSLVRRVRERADALGARLVVIDPALPLGCIGRRRPGLGRPYVVLVHGAEITVPARVPGAAGALRQVLTGAALVVASGTFPAEQATLIAQRRLPVEVIPPGIDCDRFRPPTAGQRVATRAGLGLPPEARVVLVVSRLVPRKGVDVLIAACRLMADDRPDLVLVVAGDGRERARLEHMASAARLPVRFLGEVPGERLPSLIGAADVFAMLCRNRWGGLEQEGFGIVFLEAAACGVPQVAGASGGAADAVDAGRTGLVVGRPQDPAAAAAALGRLLDDDALRCRMGDAARRRAVDDFSHDRMAQLLASALVEAESRPAPG